MVNIPIIPPASELPTELLPDISKTWKAGQVLNATVERGGENLDKILLRIGHQLLESRTPLPLKTGEQIKVLVKSLGDTPLLSILTETTLAQRAASQLRQFIAQQQDWRPLIELADQALTNPRLPTALQPLLQNLLRNLPTVEQLSQPQTLQAFIENSGVFMESRLARHMPGAEQDVKTRLQRLNSLLQTVAPASPAATDPEQAISLIQSWMRNPQTPLAQLASQLSALISPADMQGLIKAVEILKIETPLANVMLQLFAQVQKQQGSAALENLLRLLGEHATLNELKAATAQAISHINQHQLLPLVRDADSALLLLFGLPLRHEQQLHWIDFRLEREKTSSAQTAPGWSVTLNFDIPELGPMQARLHLSGKRLTTLFRASQPDTLAKIRQHLPLLQRALERSGLEIAQLDVVAGISETPTPVRSDVRILDEQA
jgi:hypothetical protein